MFYLEVLVRLIGISLPAYLIYAYFKNLSSTPKSKE